MSTTNPNRIQRGVHAGGQFTTGERSEAQVTLSQAPADIEPWELAEGIIEGQQWDVDKVADRDRWATKQWEQYYDAYHEADAYDEVGPYHEASLDTAHSAPTEFEGAATAAFTSEHDGALVVQIDTDEVASGRTVRVIVNDGALFDGDPEQHQVARIQHHNPGPGASPDHWQFARGMATATYQHARLQMERPASRRWSQGPWTPTQATVKCRWNTPTRATTTWQMSCGAMTGRRSLTARTSTPTSTT